VATIPGASTYHYGADVVGFSTVCAVAAGRVVAVGVLQGWAAGGYQVYLDHGEYTSRYCHNVTDSARVRPGQIVAEGQPLATMGRTGTATGVHSHFEIATRGARVDPIPFILARLTKPAGIGGTPFTPPLEDTMAILIRRKSDGLIGLVDFGQWAGMPDMATADINRRVGSVTDELHDLEPADFDRVTRSRGIPDHVRQPNVFWSKEFDIAEQLRDIRELITKE